MGTPGNNQNYYSPYPKNIRQYPSQTSDYMTQHAGGPQTTQNRQQFNSQRGTPHFYQSRTPQQQNYGFFEDRQSSSNANTPHFYRNNTPHQQQNRNFGHRAGRRGFHQRNHRKFDDPNADTFSQYFHSSMLEDPWHELMERHNAIHGSVVENPPKPEIET